MPRFPLVLGAVVSSCHPDRQSPLFGISPLWSFLSSDRTLAFDIGPNEAWFQSAREYRLLADEALRALRSEFPKEKLADRLLQAVPEFCGRIILTSDSPHRSWMEGRHPQEPWVWYFQDVFRVLDDPPPTGAQQDEGELPDAQSAKQLLHGWRAIDEALGLSRSYPEMSYDERRRKLAHLNDYYAGPIITGRKGSQPIVNRPELIAWWNSLEDQVEAQKARIHDKQETLRNLRPYGRTAQVVPDIGGSVKRRRKSSRSQT